MEDLTGVGAIADLATTVVRTIWPDKSAQEQQQLSMALAMVQGQMEINKVEAASPSLFVSGWRPFTGWICSAACAWNWIVISIVKAALSLAHVQIVLEKASLTEMMPVLFGLLGLGVYRTVEKIKGVS